jgi:protein-tyrosine phosphatase
MAFRGGVSCLLWWPALSFGIVSIAYLTNNAAWFGKRRDGSRQYLANAVLLPYLIFVRGVWRLQISLSKEPAINFVNSSLAVSRRLLVRELPESVDRICDLTCEFIDPKRFRDMPAYFCHPILDAGACRSSELIELARSLPPLNDQILLIHCANGHGRTGMFAAVWLLTHGFVPTVDDAIRMLKEARPGIALRARQRRLVMEAFTSLQNPNEPRSA